MDKHIGAQYYTLRDTTQTIEDFDMTCKKVSEMGMKLVQISATPLAADEMRDVLDKYGLKAALTHRNFDAFKNDIDEIISYNKTLGCDLCGLGAMPKECAGSLEAIKTFIADINKICGELKSENLYFGYHNHAFEFWKIDGRNVFDYLIGETDEETFNFIVDTYWCQVGGKNPADIITRLGKRAMALHFKDCRVSKENWTIPEMCEVGGGNLDWDGIIAAAERAGSRWAFIEQDDCHGRDPFESMLDSYNFLRTKGFC